MLRVTFYFLMAVSCSVCGRQALASNRPIRVTEGMVITHSVIIKKANYSFKAKSNLQKEIIEIRGSHIVVDFNGAILQGSADKDRPNEFSGIGLLITEGSDITIKNAVIKGFKIAILGRGAHHLTIENCDLSYNFRQHLNSDRLREDLSDWQSYHHNEKDEWMRFGAGLYLRNCDSLTICDNLITGGQCGLMMTNCQKATVYNNNFSFNSGIGIGLYRSSFNRVMNNKVDWNIRGVSDGYYYRGQDAAAILVYEQSSHNIFAYNSATHSGDGFFLWAGASTMETGEGGCNDNLLYGNDFSFAPTNGVEVTFSQNQVIRNKIEGCDNGIWGGYSYQSLIIGNLFKDNNTGIAIEQGQNNRIEANTFSGGRTGIQLWATPGRKMEGKYDVKRDVRSMNYEVKNNSFSSERTVFSLTHSQDISIQHNRIRNPLELIRLDSSVKKLLMRNNGAQIQLNDSLSGTKLAPQKIQGAKDAMLPDDHLKGRKYMMMTQWGPYDFRSPILWWTKTDSSGKMYFDIIGPRGNWKVRKVQGANHLSLQQGTVPGTLTLDRKPGESTVVELEYTGQEVTSPFGKKYPAGSPYLFGYKKIYLPQSWDVRLFSFTEATDPVKHTEAFDNMVKLAIPVAETKVNELNNSYWNGQQNHIPASLRATCATSTINFPKGSYVIGVSAGDIVRVYVDGKLVINAWDPSKIIYDADYHHDATLFLKGQHTIRVEQAQYGDYGLLYLTIKPSEKNR